MFSPSQSSERGERVKAITVAAHYRLAFDLVRGRLH
jgi:hypothetical protein